MKRLILVCSAFLTAAPICLAQRTDTRNDVRANEREADRIRRDNRNMELESHRIVVKYEKNMRGDYDFTCENKTFCNYIVEVTFPELQNLQPDILLSTPIRVTVPPGTRRIFTLRKITQGEPTRMSYRYHTFKGCTNPNVDTGFTYLLPVAPGKETRIFELYYVAKKYGGESEPKDWYSLSLHVHSGDTVFAARSGRVTEVRDKADLPDSAGISYASGENFVEISHNDCSFGNYRVFRDSAIFVHPGDWVEAGQPIGIAAGERYTGGPQVQFSVYYNFEQEIIKDGQPTGGMHRWAYVPLKFWTKDQGKIHPTNRSAYTSVHPPDLITQEMTKKEAKKWMASHKSS